MLASDRVHRVDETRWAGRCVFLRTDVNVQPRWCLLEYLCQAITGLPSFLTATFLGASLRLYCMPSSQDTWLSSLECCRVANNHPGNRLHICAPLYCHLIMRMLDHTVIIDSFLRICIITVWSDPMLAWSWLTGERQSTSGCIHSCFFIFFFIWYMNFVEFISVFFWVFIVDFRLNCSSLSIWFSDFQWISKIILQT